MVSELIARGAHKGEFLGIRPTDRAIELPVVIFCSFKVGRMASKRLYYDLATLLRQLGVGSIPVLSQPSTR